MDQQARLPTLLRPMLARAGRPFDSQEHLFEIKWDGIRALAYIERGAYRLLSRHGQDLSEQFPELAVLAELPSGTVLDGELVVLRNGRPDLSLIQGRSQLRSGHKIRVRAQTVPTTFILFDQLYQRYRPLLEMPLSGRREILSDTLLEQCSRRLLFSQAVIGAGKAFFQQVIERQLEGVMGKRLDSLYRPGRRDGAWIKIKPSRSSLKV